MRAWRSIWRPWGSCWPVQNLAAGLTLTLELNRYNLEFNLPPFGLDQRPFHATEKAILESRARLSTSAAEFEGLCRYFEAETVFSLEVPDWGLGPRA